MKYSEEILQSPQVQRAVAAAKSGTFSHAYAVVAEDEYTTGVVALQLVAAIGKLSLKRAEEGGYADVHVLPPARDKVLSADIEFITSTAYITPTELDNKFYIVKKASTMNESGQNKLLKTLEEAPPSVVIVLEVQSLAAMLPTVMSRCSRIDVPPMPLEVLTAALQRNYSSRDVYSAAALSGGYVGKAEKILSDEKFTGDFSMALDTLLNRRTAKDILTFSRRWTDRKETLPDVLDCLSVILSDCLSASEGAVARIRLKDNIKDIKTLANSFGSVAAVKIMPFIAAAKRDLSQNCNAQAVVDGLLFKILEVKTKCLKS